jgi:hypothetical protein
MRRLVLGDDDEAGGVTVQAVDDAGARRARARRELAEVKGERVGERARWRAGRGVYNHPGGLVDDHEVFVLEHDRERDLFGHEGGRVCRRQFDLYTVALAQLVRGFGRAPADQHVAVFDEALDARAAPALYARRQVGV